jgi:hypothetical protein
MPVCVILAKLVVPTPRQTETLYHIGCIARHRVPVSSQLRVGIGLKAVTLDGKIGPALSAHPIVINGIYALGVTAITRGGKEVAVVVDRRERARIGLDDGWRIRKCRVETAMSGSIALTIFVRV